MTKTLLCLVRLFFAYTEKASWKGQQLITGKCKMFFYVLIGKT